MLRNGLIPYQLCYFFANEFMMYIFVGNSSSKIDEAKHRSAKYIISFGAISRSIEKHCGSKPFLVWK